jgi:hypothetical protein
MNYEQLKYFDNHIILTGRVPHKEPPSQTPGTDQCYYMSVSNVLWEFTGYCYLECNLVFQPMKTLGFVKYHRILSWRHAGAVFMVNTLAIVSRGEFDQSKCCSLRLGRLNGEDLSSYTPTLTKIHTTWRSCRLYMEAPGTFYVKCPLYRK